MPYIKNEDREKLDFNSPESPGELNYIFTLVIKQYMRKKGESYQTYNDIIGALECCKLELYRRKIGLYENKKIAENGDVF